MREGGYDDVPAADNDDDNDNDNDRSNKKSINSNNHLTDHSNTTNQYNSLDVMKSGSLGSSGSSSSSSKDYDRLQRHARVNADDALSSPTHGYAALARPERDGDRGRRRASSSEGVF